MPTPGQDQLPPGWSAAPPGGSTLPAGWSSTPPPPPPAPTVGQTLLGGAKNFGTGLLKGAASTASNVDNYVAKIPGVGNWLTTPLVGNTTSQQARQDLSNQSQAHGTMQELGKGAEQAAEFLIPGGAEERLVAKGAELAPKAAPLLRVGGQALSSGLMNKAQGGTFKSGAEMGAGAGVLGEGMRAAAPTLAEKAIGIRGKFDRSFNKTPGRALLDETHGITPEGVATQAKSKISDLTGQTEALADKASVKPNPVRGLLPAPAEEMPLHSAPDVAGTPSRPVTLNQPDRPTAKLLPAPNHTLPSSSHADIFPEQLPQGSTNISTHTPSEASGMRADQYVGQVPGDRGGPGQVQGVYIRHPQGGSGEVPSTVPNPIASLAPARGEITSAMRGAANRNAEGTFSQLQGMGKTLHNDFLTGAPIPENVTPRQLLDTRRGFNEEHLNWNPDTHEPATAAARNAYGALTGEFHRVVPEAVPLDARVSNLMPVANRAKIAALNDNTAAKILGRFGAHTGALGGALTGGYAGYQHGGAKDAVLGGLAGVAVPELIASPQGQLAAARLFNHPGPLTRPLTGALLNLGRNWSDNNQQ